MNKYLFWSIVGVSAFVVIAAVVKRNKENKAEETSAASAQLKKEAEDLIRRIGQKAV